MKTKKMVQGVEIKTVVACTILAVILALTSLIPVAMAVGGKLWLDTISEDTYVDDSEDPWLCETTITADKDFELEIYYHHGADIHHLYLLVAVDRDPKDIVEVSVNSVPVTDYNGVITDNNKALIETDPPYEYSGAGIYKSDSSTRFEVVGDILDANDILEPGENITVPIEIITHSSVKVHFDAVGSDNNNEVIACNPHSHDVTHVPEFGTIAMAIASIFGLVFFFSRKKQKE